MKSLMNGLALSIMAYCATTVTHAAPSFTIKNDSSFFLFAKDSGPGCPATINPGGTAQVSEYWCGYLACATENYDKEKGCMELNSDKSALTEGGYATWFSLSLGNKLCTVPDGNIYQCSLNNDTLNFSYKNITQVYSAGTQKGQPVTVAQPTQYQNGPKFRGVNISGLEYDGTFLDAMYQHPDLPDARYFISQGMNIIRLPIRWEFVLSTTATNFIESSDPVSKNINSMYLDSIYDTVEKYLKNGIAVDVDLHNYMRFCETGKDVGQANEPTDPIKNKCKVVTTQQLAYIWGVIAKRLAPLAQKYPDLLMFEIMNEPYSYVEDGKKVPGQILMTKDLFNLEVAAAQEIRKYAKDNYILLSGNYWSPLHGWTTESPFTDDVPNGEVFTAANLKKSGLDTNRIIIDMHQYFDYNYSGTHKECKKFESYSHFKQVMALENAAGVDIFGQWLKTNGLKVFLGEFGASSDDNCKEDLNFMLRYVDEHAYDASKSSDGGFIGWTAWRSNRHTGNAGFAPFNYLQAEDYTVYGAGGSKFNSGPGTGIIQGEGNSLMLPDPVFSFSNYLIKAN
jgi:endoglucanase